MIHFNSKLVPNSKIAIAVSMGVDSVAGAHFLSKSRDIHMIHVNHGTDMADQYEGKFYTFAKFLEETSRNEVTYDVKHVHPKSFSESDMRNARYEAFSESILENMEGGTIVVCHHLDDCVESYLMNCFNGVPERRPIPSRTDWMEFVVVRPFLKTSKKDFRKYANDNDLTKFTLEDPTNDNECIRRNWIRNNLIPNIELNYPGLKKIVKKRMANF